MPRSLVRIELRSRRYSAPEVMVDTPSAAESRDAPPAERDSDDDLIGRVFDDKYRLEAHLGGGGMGDVYRAEHTLMHKTVAVKVLRPDVADDSIIERFRREAAAAGNLDHPNICAATDFARTGDGYFYLVMEYVDGESLQTVVDDRGALPADEAATIADGIAAALERAAEFDVVHRDLKPDNVMLVDDDGEPTVKVLDFGVAHVEFNDEMPSLTKTGAVFGTPKYMSPEQATGDEVGPRADLYGLGVVLFEMLTGRELFEERESAQLMAAHITEAPERPSEARPDLEIPAELDDLVMELLAKRPEERLESAGEVRSRLRAHLHGDEETGASGAEDATVVARPGASESPDASGHQGIRNRLEDLVDDPLSSGNPFNVVLAVVAGFLGLTCAGLSVMSLLMLLDSSPDDMRESLEASRSQFRKQPAVSEALEPLERGRPADAVEKLEALRDKRGTSTSAHLHFLVGRTYEKVGNGNRALAGYADAVRAKPRYLHAERVRRAIGEAFGSRDPDRVDRARELLESYSAHPAVRKTLGDLGWRPEDDDTRERAIEFLREQGLWNRLADWRRLSIELRRADNCDDYEKYIDALVATGDERAAQMIEIYHEKPPAGCGFLKAEDCYDCVREDLADALETLRSPD